MVRSTFSNLLHRFERALIVYEVRHEAGRDCIGWCVGLFLVVNILLAAIQWIVVGPFAHSALLAILALAGAFVSALVICVVIGSLINNALRRL